MASDERDDLDQDEEKKGADKLPQRPEEFEQNTRERAEGERREHGLPTIERTTKVNIPEKAVNPKIWRQLLIIIGVIVAIWVFGPYIARAATSGCF